MISLHCLVLGNGCCHLCDCVRSQYNQTTASSSSHHHTIESIHLHTPDNAGWMNRLKTWHDTPTTRPQKCEFNTLQPQTSTHTPLSACSACCTLPTICQNPELIPPWALRIMQTPNMLLMQKIHSNPHNYINCPTHLCQLVLHAATRPLYVVHPQWCLWKW